MAAFTHNPYRTLSNVGTWGEKGEGRHFDNKFSTLRHFQTIQQFCGNSSGYFLPWDNSQIWEKYMRHQ